MKDSLPEKDKNNFTGTLYIVSTPIGNLGDITLRALETLKTCDVILAEDTRHTRNLVSKYDIHTPLEAYHAFNEHAKTQNVLERIRNGLNAALVTDAGTPCVADPGFLLVREAVKEGITPVVIPGVSSLTFAIAASGLPSDRFTFFGFLPVKSGRRAAVIKEIASVRGSAVVFESPYRVAKLLAELSAALGEETPCAVIREATKLHEEVLRGTLSSIIESTHGRVWKGECVIVVSPSGTPAEAEEEEERT